jgi:hypothetical protein
MSAMASCVGSRSEMIAELELLNASHCQMIQELKQENETTKLTCMKEIEEYHKQIADQDVRPTREWRSLPKMG